MTATDQPQTPAGRACTGLALAAIAAGVLAWAWLGPWQWALTGAVTFVIVLWVGSLMDTPQARNRRAATWCTGCGRIRRDLDPDQTPRGEH